MITVRKAADRGHARSDWLDSRHTFSFDTYDDPRHRGFRSLRVINQDRVAPGRGFPLHRHEDMEVISLVLEGQLKHEDDLGQSAVIGPGEAQRFSAGTGIRHSEYNPSDRDDVHFLQIWILPERRGLPPGYEQKRFAPEEYRGRLRRLGSRDGRDGSLTIHQDAELFRAVIETGSKLEYPLPRDRYAWVQVIGGLLSVNGQALGPGDGAAIAEEDALRFEAEKEADILLFDLA